MVNNVLSPSMIQECMLQMSKINQLYQLNSMIAQFAPNLINTKIIDAATFGLAYDAATRPVHLQQRLSARARADGQGSLQGDYLRFDRIFLDRAHLHRPIEYSYIAPTFSETHFAETCKKIVEQLFL